MSESHVSGPLFVGGMPVGFRLPAAFDNKVFYVDADNGADGRTGLTPEKAFKTPEAGYAALRTNKHDILVFSANGSHTLADELIVDKNRVHFVSADFGGRHYGQATKLNLGVTTGVAIAAIKNTGIRNSFHGLKITNSDTLSTSLYGVAEAGEFSLWEFCEILKTTDLDQTGAAELLHNGDSCKFVSCAVGNGIYTPTVARQNVLFTRETVTGKVARDVTFVDCYFINRAGATTLVNLRFTGNDVERLFLMDRCKFVAVKTSPQTQARVCGVASALTDAELILDRCIVQNISKTGSNTDGVFTSSPAPVALGTETVAVHTS